MAGLDRGDIGLAEAGQLADAKLALVEVEQCVDDTALEMDMLVERIAEAMDETDGAKTGVAYFRARLCNFWNRNMLRWNWVVLIPIALALTAALSINRARQPMEGLADQCVRIYADELPKGVRIRHVRQDGPSLIVYVHHLDWAGEIRCALYRNGLLDEVESLNRKTDVFWSEPPFPSTP